MKIVHISDLHFCHPDSEAKVLAFERKIEALLGLPDHVKYLLTGRKVPTGKKFEVGRHDKNLIRPLINAIASLAPDVLCVTGDITTFGDKESYAFALKEFFEPVVQECKKLAGKMIIIPGNHDAIEGLTGRWGLLPRNYINAKKNRSPILANYSDFAREPIFASTMHFESKGIGFYCYDSTSNQPYLVNKGYVDSNQLTGLTKVLEQNKKRGNENGLGGVADISIFLMHHNPISSHRHEESYKDYLYNGTPNAGALLKVIQEGGMDLVLYGHEHEFNCLQLDIKGCKEGHLNLIGCRSSLERPEYAGFNVIEITGRASADVSHYVSTYSAAGSRFEREGAPHVITLESTSIVDRPTIDSRVEIQRSQYDDDDHSLWNRAFPIEEGANVLYLGPRQSEVASTDSIEQITTYLNGKVKVNILLSDPDLFSLVVKGLEIPEAERVNQMWDASTREEGWKNQSEKARTTIKKLLEFYRTLGAQEKELIELRLSHTLLPIGARGFNLNLDSKRQKANGRIKLRLLPVGMFGKNKRPTLDLHEKSESSLFHFYEDYIKSLWRGVENNGVVKNIFKNATGSY